MPSLFVVPYFACAVF